MALCGKKFFDERKQVEVFDHRLKNLFGYTARKKKMALCGKEGLLIKNKNGDPIDRRTKIVYKDEKFRGDSFGDILQIKVKLPRGGYFVGSGLLSWLHYDCVITAAHNLADFNVLHDSMVKYKEGHAYSKRQGVDVWFTEYEIDVKNAYVHPNYRGNSKSGFDIGFCPLKKPTVKFALDTYTPSKWKYDYAWTGNVKPEDLTMGLKVEVVGYPGELNGYPYYHDGRVVKSLKTKEGGWLLYYDADCTPGNSGSPIYATDESWIKKYCSSKLEKLVIGIHVGYDPVAGLNFGTVLTEALCSWIGKQKLKIPPWRILFLGDPRGACYISN